MKQKRRSPRPKVCSHHIIIIPPFAIDVVFVNNGKTDWSEKWFKAFAPYMSNPKIEWGGIWKFKDMPHYEVKGWKSFKE